MKKILFSFFLFSMTYIANAQPPDGEANPGEWYGERVDPDGMVDIARIPAQLAKTPTFDTKVKAKIIDVCPKKGCWLKLQVNDSTTALVKMKDYGFFLPLAAKGKTVVLEGEVKIKKHFSGGIETLCRRRQEIKRRDRSNYKTRKRDPVYGERDHDT